MALLAEDLIDEARDFHESFGEGRVPTRMLLRALSRAEQSLYRAVVHLSETALATTRVFDEFDLQFTTTEGEPLELPAHLVVLSLEAKVADRLVPIPILFDDSGAFQSRSLVGYLRGRELLLGPYPRVYAPGTAAYLAAYDWSSLQELRVNYVPHPVDVTAVTQELTAPDQARPFLVAELVSFMATRLNHSAAAALAAAAESEMESVAHSFVDAVGGAHWSVKIV